jgi:peptidoglycan/LPS O-acetylase OafA/YrhL
MDQPMEDTAQPVGREVEPRISLHSGDNGPNADGVLLLRESRAECNPLPTIACRQAVAHGGGVNGEKDFQRLVFLDALRGLGALGIASYHIHRYQPLREPVDALLPQFAKIAFSCGWLGVQIFWVIAGFVLAYSLRNAAIKPGTVGNFTLRRVVRLGVPYWTTILLVVAIDFVTRRYTEATSLTEPISWQKLSANLVFLQDVLGYGNISAGTWFVCIDLQFSLLFVLLLGLAGPLSFGSPVGGKIHAFVIAILFVPLGLLSLFWFGLDAQNDACVCYFFFIPLLGAMAWWALEGRIPRVLFWAYAATLAAGAAYRWHLGLPNSKSPLAITVATTVGVIVYLVGRRGHLGDWLSATWLQYLGRISYSLFLIHYPVSWLFLCLGCRLTGDHAISAAIWLAVALMASIVAADWMYTWIESPSLRLIRRMKNGTRPVYKK